MKQNIIKTDNYLLIISDEEIKENDFFYDLDTNYLKIKQSWENSHLDFNSKKIIAHLPLNNSPILEGVDLLPPLEDEVEKLSADYTEEWCGKRKVDVYIHDAFKGGYNKAKEKYKYTEEDMRKVCIMYAQWVTGGTPSLRIAQNPDERFEQIIQSLQQSKYPIGFECEIEVCVFGNHTHYDPKNEDYVKPKTTTNSQGQEVLEGKYIYE